MICELSQEEKEVLLLPNQHLSKNHWLDICGYLKNSRDLKLWLGKKDSNWVIREGTGLGPQIMSGKLQSYKKQGGEHFHQQSDKRHSPLKLAGIGVVGAVRGPETRSTWHWGSPQNLEIPLSPYLILDCGSLLFFFLDWMETFLFLQPHRHKLKWLVPWWMSSTSRTAKSPSTLSAS